MVIQRKYLESNTTYYKNSIEIAEIIEEKMIVTS